MFLLNRLANNGHRSRGSAYRPMIEAFEERTLLSFLTTPSYAAGTNPMSVAVRDFNGDGVPDLVVGNDGTISRDGGTLSILLGNGDGTFQAAQSYAIATYYESVWSVAVGDFNGDGIQDLVAVAGALNSGPPG